MMSRKVCSPPPSKKHKSEDGNLSNVVDLTGSADNTPAVSPVTSIVPTKVTHTGKWNVSKDKNIIYRTPQHFRPPLQSKSQMDPSKASASASVAVAGFDLSGTILTSEKQFPHSLSDYSLYNNNVISKLRQFQSQSREQIEKNQHGHVLIIFINQGGIRGAVNGKTAGNVKDLIEWLSSMIRNNSGQQEEDSIYAFVSTQKKSGYHKPSNKMWIAAQEILQCKFDQKLSFFVGDGEDYVDDKTGEKMPGDDESFARNVGLLGNPSNSTSNPSSGHFFTPQNYFGISHLESKAEQRTKVQEDGRLEYDIPPKSALDIRAALLSGYLDVAKGMMLLLCGGQGSGKSYFCNSLLKTNDDDDTDAIKWVHLSQDTISKGKPGSREAVERAAKRALANRQCVIIDRMHLDPTQRSHFIKVAKKAQVPVHILALTTPIAIVKERVLHRKNHVGKVGGQSGVKMASKSWSELIMPKYEEGFDLISATGTEDGVRSFVRLYGRILGSGFDSVAEDGIVKPFPSPVPLISLGTYRLGKKLITNIIPFAADHGIHGVDTAPTYNNEAEVGNAIKGTGAKSMFCIAKIPKRATTGTQVRQEFQNTLKNLGRTKVHLLLLHWPCDVLVENTLKEVWNAMEDCVKDRMADALGVCNFNIEALRLLLPHCRTVRPTVNQVERHVQLPQWELVDYCAQQDICIQAHSPLGQGKLLENDVVKEVAARSGLTPAQVLVGWNLRQQTPVVAKCSSEEHLLDVVGAQKSSSVMKIGGGDHVLSANDLESLNAISQRVSRRFVSPPFMFGKKSFCWGKSLPK